MFPPLVTAAFAFALVIASFKDGIRKFLPHIALIGLLASLAVVVYQFYLPAYDFFNVFRIDGLSLVFDVLFLAVAMLVVLHSGGARKTSLAYYVSILFATAGAMLVSHSVDLIGLFVGLELASVSFYPLISSNRDKEGLEASVKFFVVSIFSAGALLFGMSLLYGATGSTRFASILSSVTGMSPSLLLAIAFIGAGLSFKIGAFPFNLWVPDVYEGAPGGITGLLASVSKKAGFVALFKIFILTLPLVKLYWIWPFAVLSLITMGVGNIVAVAQGSVKRMFAYSTIGQAGYILIAMAVPTALGLAAGMLQIVTHAIAMAGVFIIVSVLESQGIRKAEDYSGLGGRQPLLSFGLLIFMSSLAGIPPLAGFFSKFYLFSAAIKGGFWWLAVAAIVFAVVSLYYYFRIVRRMFLDEPKHEVKVSTNSKLAILAAVLFLLLFAVFAEPVFSSLISIAGSILAKP